MQKRLVKQDGLDVLLKYFSQELEDSLMGSFS